MLKMDYWVNRVSNNLLGKGNMMEEVIPTPKADRLVETVGATLRFDNAERSFSPWYSDIGLGFDDRGGIGKLYLHYNRKTISVGDPFFGLPIKPDKTKCDPVSVRQVFPQGQSAAFSFTGHNTWVARLEGFPAIVAPLGSGPYRSLRAAMHGSDTIMLDAYLPTGDKRDPDVHVPIVIGVRVIIGSMGYDLKRHRLKLKSDKDGKIVVAFHVQILDIDHEQVAAFLKQAPSRIDQAVDRCKQWLDRGIGKLKLDDTNPAKKQMASRAALTLLYNCAVAPGNLAGRMSAFPSRGRYPAHYMWDACFQNLALEQMEERLAEDALLLLMENMRVDGKMPHFLCSTWMRPEDSQPPLVGWAAMRLVKQRDKEDFIRHILDPLIRNNRWWLTQRMTRHGLITCHSPFETGWDNTPRFDEGPVVAVDMNAYLITQLRAAADIAQLAGNTSLAEQNDEIADTLCDKLLELCYSEADNLFYDIDVVSGKKVRIKTPACFLPLMTDVGLAPDKAKQMISDYLLDPELFFGEVPFPSVAYDEPSYSQDMWRGPTWLPIAYLLLEILDEYGFDDQARTATQRLHDIVIKDGHLSEYFNSQTGEGLGAHEQGWTAAIYLKLRERLATESKPPAFLEDKV